MKAPRRLVGALAGLLMLAGCASAPPPDWALNSHGAMQRALAAYLDGNTRVGDIEFALARAELARTARPELLARAELLRCATRVASLMFEPCAGYLALQADATPADQAYARYLRGQPQAGDIDLLPGAQRAAAKRLLSTSAAPAQDALADSAEPLSRLVAAGVLLQADQANPALMELAASTASAQGWRQPLLAWLSAQLRVAEQGQALEQAQRLRRRIALLQGLSGPAVSN